MKAKLCRAPFDLFLQQIFIIHTNFFFFWLHYTYQLEIEPWIKWLKYLNISISLFVLYIVGQLDLTHLCYNIVGSTHFSIIINNLALVGLLSTGEALCYIHIRHWLNNQSLFFPHNSMAFDTPSGRYSMVTIDSGYILFF
jgi:hypothetical protein